MVRLPTISMRRGLMAVLAVQTVVASLMLINDFGSRLAPTFSERDAVPSGPISPGDQIRRYQPSQFRPDYASPATLPEISLPDELPSRLEFTEHEIADIGPVLLLNGAIEPGDAERLSAYLESSGGGKLPVALNSPGGVVDEALAIGRMIRERDLVTMVLPGMMCTSSCPYILAGGTERRVSRRGAVGLHQHYYMGPGYIPVFLAVEDIQRNQSRTMQYLIDMGIDPGVMVHALVTPPDDIYVLVEEELLASALATAVVD